MPKELQKAAFIVQTCKHFGCLPSQLLEEDAELLKLLTLYDRGGFNETPEEEGGE